MSAELYEKWVTAKYLETQAIAERREVEDELTKYFALNEMHEGSETKKLDGYVIKITQRLSNKIDAEGLQTIAAQEGLTDHLSTLFTWKPQVDKKAWDSASESITSPLSDAITQKAGRASYTILKEI